jgi:eukaryotic-like serine/threonine-protein kinase
MARIAREYRTEANARPRVSDKLVRHAGAPVTAEPPADPLIGATIDGRWQVKSRLSGGAMGTVYLAERTQLGRQVAVKVLHEEYSASDEFVRRFAREARALSRLQHINCITILDVGSHGNRPYIVMELVPGKPLTAELGAPTMTPVRAVTVIRQTLIGLAHAHSHEIVHRDLKPDNIMIAEHAGVGPVVKILDFGFAHFADSRMSKSSAELVPGTPSYMSPEQAQGLKADLRTDLYSAGIILWELCVGHKLYVAGDAINMLKLHVYETPVSPRLAAPERQISEALDAVIMRALTKDREHRFQTAAEFQEALDATPEGRQALGQSASGGGAGKLRYAVALALIVLALLGVAAALKLR